MYKLCKAFACSVLISFSAQAQTNPTPWNLETQNHFSFTSLSATAAALPSGMAIHQMSSSPVSVASTPTSDIPLPLNNQQQASRTNVWGLNANGIGMRSNPAQATGGYSNGRLGEVVVAVNTTNRTNVQVSFLAGTHSQRPGQGAIFRLRCEYRIGTSGAWLQLPGGPVEYALGSTGSLTNFGPVALPSSVDHQPVVQVRWVWYYVSGQWTNTNHNTGRVRLDDISITSIPRVVFPAFGTICPGQNTFALNSATPAGGTYSGTGVVNNTFSPALSGVGTFPITYAYTDAFGNSNSAIQNITVDYNGCVTQLNSAWCGRTNVNLNQIMVGSQIPGATNYEFRVTNAALNYSYSRVKGNAVPDMPLSWILGLQYGNTYNVEIRGFLHGQWRNYGPICTITLLPTIPLTQLNSTSCGATNLTLANSITTSPVAAAQNYEYHVTCAATGYNVTRQMGSPTWSIPLTWFPNMAYGQTYDVEVRSRVGGVWGAFGPTCQISLTSDIPLTQLASGSCNAQNLTTSSILNVTPVAGAQDYEYLVTNTALNYNVTRLRGSGTPSIAVSWFANIQTGHTYNVQVRAKVAGVWGNYGQVCTITLGSAAREMQVEDAVIPFGVNVFPNPGDGITNPTIQIAGANNQAGIITVFDLSGKVMMMYRVNVTSDFYVAEMTEMNQLAAGAYLIRVTAGDNTETIRYIKN